MPRRVNQSLSSEPDQMPCSDLNLPLLTFEDLVVVKNYLRHLSYKHCTVLDRDAINSDAVRLCSMCQIIIDNISALVLETVQLQVLSKPHVHVPTDVEGTASNWINGEPLLDGCSYCRVTEDDIEASFDTILEKCFGLALGLEQKRSNESDRLRTLFSAKIATNVNSKLRHITGSTSLQPDESISPSNLKEMADHIIKIVIKCTNPQLSLEAAEVKTSEQDSAKTYLMTDIAQTLDECLAFLDSLNLGSSNSEEDEHVQITNVKDFQQDGATTSDIIPSSTRSTDSLWYPSATPPPDHPTCSDDKLFLTGCLKNPQISLETTDFKKSEQDSAKTCTISDDAQQLDECLAFSDSVKLGSLDSEEDEPQISFETSEVKTSGRDSAKTCTISDDSQHLDESLAFPDSVCSGSLDAEKDEHVQITNVKDFKQDGSTTSDIVASTTKSTDSLRCLSATPPPDLPTCSDDELFPTVFLTNLFSHIANKTHTAAANLDFHQIVTQVKERLVEEQSYTVLQNSEDLHITIYKELCRKFGSKYLLLAMMEKDDAAFAAALVEMLQAQLKKLTGKKSSKNMWRIFRRNHKVSSVCTDKSPESHSEEHKERNGSTPSYQDQKCSRNTRTFSSMFTCLRKAFTWCIISQE